MRTGHCLNGHHDGCPASLACFCICHGTDHPQVTSLACAECSRPLQPRWNGRRASAFCDRACWAKWRDRPAPEFATAAQTEAERWADA